MMRLVRQAILVSLFIAPLLAAPVPAAPASTLPPRPAVPSAPSQPCQQLLPQGVYEGTTSAVMTIRLYDETGAILLQEFTINDTGQLSLTIACTVTAGAYHWNVHRTLMFAPGTTPTVCDYTADLSQPSGNVVAGTNGQPRIDVRWGQGVINPNDCVDAGPADTAATWRFSMAGPPQGRTISGDFRILYDNPDAQDYDQMAQMFRDQGFQVTLTKGWTMTRKPQPAVQSLTSSLRQYFLAGIPVTNRYTAAINWDGGTPGTARFIVGNTPPRNMTVAGNSASYDLPLASIQGTGDFPLSVEAELDGRINRLDNLGPLTLVPVPAWAGPFNFQPQVQAGSVRYSGQYAVPSTPLNAHVVLPSFLPYVGGTWGLLPTQLRLNLAANSLGTRETGNLSAQGGFGLGQNIYTLGASGNIYGTLTSTSLNFESEQLSLSTPRISFSKHIGLLSVIPEVEQLYSLPVLGNLIKGLNSALGVTGEVHGSMTGRGRLGVSGSTLALTEGSFDATLGVQATGGIDTPFLGATVSGGGEGSLSMQIVPTPKVNSCKVLFTFAAQFHAFGLPPAQAQRQWSLYSCSAAANVASEAADPLSPTTFGPAQVDPVEAYAMLAQVTNGVTETVLVTNTTSQAKPVLVSGPNGRLALVWNSAGVSGTVNAVSARLFNGSTWGNAFTVSQAARPAFTPSAAFAANGRLLVAWAEAQTAPDPSGLTLAFARSLDIAWAQVDPATTQVISRGRVLSDTVMDFAPRLSAAADGTVWLAWQSSPGADLAGTTASPNQWKAAAWTGSGWTASEVAGANGVGTLYWDVAAVNSAQVWMVADVDVDGNLATATDREIYVYKRTAAGWAAPFRRTNDAVIDSGPLLALTPAGQPVLAWRHGDGVMGLAGDPTTTPPQTWFNASSGNGPMLGAGRLLAGADGTRTLVWADGTARGQDVWLSRFTPATQNWSQPAPVFRTAEQRRGLSAALQPGGDILLGLAAAPVLSQTVTFTGGTAIVPVVGSASRLLVSRIPAGYVPPPEITLVFLPRIAR